MFSDIKNTKDVLDTYFPGEVRFRMRLLLLHLLQQEQIDPDPYFLKKCLVQLENHLPFVLNINIVKFCTFFFPDNAFSCLPAFPHDFTLSH